jgi:hypothetical protein
MIMVVLALVVLTVPLAADADHDRNRIDEVMAGFAGDPTVQFVELQMLEDGHHCQATAGLREPPPEAVWRKGSARRSCSSTAPATRSVSFCFRPTPRWGWRGDRS